jgi:xylose isomerase
MGNYFVGAKEYFPGIGKIPYEGPKSDNPLAFKYYDPERKVGGKTMREQLRFAVAYWHSFCADGTDPFGAATHVHPWTADARTPMEAAEHKIDAAFEFITKLGAEFYCFHDRDMAPEGVTPAESEKNLAHMVGLAAERQSATGVKLLWGTANLFNNPRFMNGAATNPEFKVVAHAAAQVKAAIDATIALGGRGYVFWGGREGYETLMNTDMKFELENIAALMKMAVQYGRSIGFTGDFYIEPKPKEPMKHQYDYDAATAVGFLRQYGLDKDFKLNVEANHATLAGHTFQHDLRIAAINGMLGSVDANQGDLLLGWDTDEFPYDVYETTLCMYEILKAGGLTGGLNFDAKNRRPSYTLEDMFHAFILGMDSFALGLLKAAAIIEDGRIDGFVKERYASYAKTPIGKKIRAGKATLEECAAIALKNGAPKLPGSGRQEYIENVINQIFFK